MDAPHPKAALDSINELPENILIELFTHVPARQLLLNCRLVCSLWRDLIDLMTLWKRKCLREGFITEDWDHLHRNLLRNPCGWTLDLHTGSHLGFFKKYFVTSYEMCLKSQLVDLVAEGYWEELLDTFRPDIVVKDWFAARADCGCTYQLKVQLASADYFVLASFEPPPVTIQQWNNATWTEVSYTFSDYPRGVRYILFQHGGRDTQYWAGWYGPRVTNSSIVVSPKMTRNQASSEAQPGQKHGQEEAAQSPYLAVLQIF
uniref:F-box protein 6 n=1 Tax=Nomascus leucogenys TaxID=61853 RepID=A0A2I3GAR4_NOMLE